MHALWKVHVAFNLCYIYQLHRQKNVDLFASVNEKSVHKKWEQLVPYVQLIENFRPGQYHLSYLAGFWYHAFCLISSIHRTKSHTMRDLHFLLKLLNMVIVGVGIRKRSCLKQLWTLCSHVREWTQCLRRGIVSRTHWSTYFVILYDGRSLLETQTRILLSSLHQLSGRGFCFLSSLHTAAVKNMWTFNNMGFESPQQDQIWCPCANVETLVLCQQTQDQTWIKWEQKQKDSTWSEEKTMYFWGDDTRVFLCHTHCCSVFSSGSFIASN